MKIGENKLIANLTGLTPSGESKKISMNTKKASILYVDQLFENATLAMENYSLATKLSNVRGFGEDGLVEPKEKTSLKEKANKFKNKVVEIIKKIWSWIVSFLKKLVNKVKGLFKRNKKINIIGSNKEFDTAINKLIKKLNKFKSDQNVEKFGDILKDKEKGFYDSSFKDVNLPKVTTDIINHLKNGEEKKADMNKKSSDMKSEVDWLNNLTNVATDITRSGDNNFKAAFLALDNDQMNSFIEIVNILKEDLLKYSQVIDKVAEYIPSVSEAE